MGSVFSTPYKVVHLAHIVSDEEDPDTGNQIIKEIPPVTRKYMALSQIGRLRGSSKAVHSPEFLERVDTELHMAVPDPAIYNAGDIVVLHPEFDEDCQWIPGTGFKFDVDGMAINSGTSPWPALMKGLGGVVRIRRTT